MEPLFTVVTIFTAPNGQKIVHSYGPYTQGQADYQRRCILKTTGSEVQASGGTLEVISTKILDPERRTPFIWGKDPAK